MSTASANILIVDSDFQLRSSVSDYLEQRGYSVVQCASLADAKQKIVSERPKCVVLETQLDDGSGLELVEYIQALSETISTIFYSVDCASNTIVPALRAGAANFLVKPLKDLEILALSVDRAVRMARLESEYRRNETALLSANRELRENIHLLERDHAAGRLVQQKFLPPSPVSLGGLHVSYRIYPSLYLSGDAIDYGLLNDRYLAFYLTDISGHGAASAFVAVWVRQLVRGLFKEKSIFHSRASFENDAPELMQHINHALIKAEISQHLTCFVGVIDTLNNDMVYVMGGHLPVPMLVSEGRCTPLEGNGKPLGIFDDAEWQLKKVNLSAEFSLVAFSDGVLEVLPENNLVEKEAFLRHKMSNANGYDLDGLRTLLEIEDLSAPPDDVAMLLIRKG